MLGRGYVLAISVVTISLVTVLSIEAQQDSNIPQWIKNNAAWWADDLISDYDFKSGIVFLMEDGLLSTNPIPDEFPSYLKTDSKNWSDGVISDKEYLLKLENWIENYPKSIPKTPNNPPAFIPKNELTNPKLPEWIRNVFVWYASGKVSEDELLNSIRYLVQERIIILNESSSIENLNCDALYDEVIDLFAIRYVFSKIAFGMLELAINTELLDNEQMTESILAETSKKLKATDEKLAVIIDNRQFEQCSFTAQQGDMIKFLKGYFDLRNE